MHSDVSKTSRDGLVNRCSSDTQSQDGTENGTDSSSGSETGIRSNIKTNAIYCDVSQSYKPRVPSSSPAVSFATAPENAHGSSPVNETSSETLLRELVCECLKADSIIRNLHHEVENLRSELDSEIALRKDTTDELERWRNLYRDTEERRKAEGIEAKMHLQWYKMQMLMAVMSVGTQTDINDKKGHPDLKTQVEDRDERRIDTPVAEE